jgi:hypothetical protein
MKKELTNFSRCDNCGMYTVLFSCDHQDGLCMVCGWDICHNCFADLKLPEPTHEQKEEFEKVKQEAMENYLERKPTEMV